MNLLRISLAVALVSATVFTAEAQKSKQKSAKDGYTLTGTIQNASGKVYLEEMTSLSSFIKKDSAVFNKDGSFTMQGKVDKPGLYRLFFGGNLAMLLPV